MKTFDVEIKKTIKFTEEDLNDILCSCFEGGCSYWCCIDNDTMEWDEAKEMLRKNGNTYPTIEDIMLQIMIDNRAVRLIDEEDDVVLFMTLNSFLKGIELSITEGFWSGEETMDVDGVVGDAIIQYAVFGEQIYG